MTAGRFYYYVRMWFAVAMLVAAASIAAKCVTG